MFDGDERIRPENPRGLPPPHSLPPLQRTERRFLVSLTVLMAALAIALPWIAEAGYRSSGDFHAAMEAAGALLALVAGVAMIACFHALGDRFHLLVGLALFVNGAEDLLHGLLSHRNLFGFSEDHLAHAVPATFVVGRLMLGALLIVAASAGKRMGTSRHPQRETAWAASIVLAVSMVLTVLAFAAPLPRLVFPEHYVARPLDLLAAAVLLVALVGLVRKHRRDRDMLTRWLCLSVAIHVMGEVLISFSNSFFDVYFDAGHVYKLLGYTVPLLGFSFYQTAAIYQRQQAERRVDRLNSVLRAIRNVNQLISRESDGDRLLSGICRILVESRGYLRAWITLADHEGRPHLAADSGMEGNAAGEAAEALVRLAEQAVAAHGVMILQPGSQGDPSGPQAHSASSVSAPSGPTLLALSLAHGGRLLGAVAAVLPPGLLPDHEEQELLEEAAGDIAFALHGLEVEHERHRAQDSLELERARLEALLRLDQMTDAPLQAITDFALEEAVRLTQSEVGYLAFTSDDESVLTMHSWSKTAMRECAIINKPIVYRVVETGLWGEAIRQRKPVITNDYPAPNPMKKGFPEGHVAIARHMNIPVFDGTRIVAVAGVGNKREGYDQSDVRQLTLLMQGMWRLLQRRTAEEELRKARDDLEVRVQSRTAELAEAVESLKHERYLLHTLMDNLPHNIYFKDSESRFTRINRAMAHYFGLREPAQAVGMGDQDFFSSEHVFQTLQDERQIVRTGQPILDKEERETWPDGSVTWVSTTKMPLYDDDGRIIGTFGISRDITQQKQAEETLHAAKKAAEAASRAKSTFLANMSHEIRTPLNAIIGMTELVLDTSLSSQQREFLAVVRDSGEGLLSVINDILDFSKIEAGKLAMENSPFDVRESLGDTMKSFAIRAHKQGLELACFIHSEVPTVIVGDQNRLRQVVVNLVGNAIKFTRQGEVVLEVSTHAHEDGLVELHFAVRDTGIGIPEDKRELIFHPFEQADSTMTRRFGGTGLGLAISSRLVERMGGRIWLESQVGQGSTFHFHATFGMGQLQTRRRTGELTSLTDLPVLVVDDNLTNGRILEEVLRNWTMQPEIVTNGPEAIKRLSQAAAAGRPFRLVLTDAHMPDMDGFSLAEAIQGNDRLRSTIIMMLTSGDQPEDPARCAQLGIARYLLKPIKQSELFDAIAAALGLSAVEDATHPSVLARAGRLGPLQILLAEDSLVNQKLAVALLERQGHQVEVVTSGREALEAVDRKSFDLVLMDVQMPEMDGLEAASTIRAREQGTGRHLPIIAMTAHALKGDRERCLEAGMDDYVSKPIRARQLLEKMERVLEGGPVADAPSAATAVAAAEVPWEQVCNDLGGDASLVLTVVRTALEEVPGLVRSIRAALEAGDGQGLRLAAHTLKGSLKYFGESEVLAGARRLEKMGQEGDFTEGSEVLARLAEDLGRFSVILAAYLREHEEDC